MITAVNETTKRAQEIVATFEGALRVDPSGTRYQDLGLVIDGNDVAAGASVFSPWYDKTQWVRNILFASQSDRNYNISVSRRDSTESDVGSVTIGTDQAANAPSWRTTIGTGATGLMGYGCRFSLKNQDAINAADMKLRVQFMG